MQLQGGTNPGGGNMSTGNPSYSEGVSPGGHPPDHIFGVPEDVLIILAVVTSVAALLIALRRSFGKVGDDGLPHPNYAAIFSAVAVLLGITVGAAIFVTRLDARVTQLEREAGSNAQP